MEFWRWGSAVARPMLLRCIGSHEKLHDQLCKASFTMLKIAYVCAFGGLASIPMMGPVGLAFASLGLLMLAGGMVVSVWRML